MAKHFARRKSVDGYLLKDTHQRQMWICAYLLPKNCKEHNLLGRNSYLERRQSGTESAHTM